MLRNYFLIAVRSLVRHKVYASLNLVGLVVGFACVTMMALFVQYELSFDSHQEKRSRIYRVVRELRSVGGSSVSYRTSGPLAAALAEDQPEVEAAARTFWWYTYLRADDRDASLRLRTCIADPSFIDIFSLKWRSGNPKTAFLKRGAAVLTASAAVRLFGDADPIGERLQVDEYGREDEYVITGVVDDWPATSSFRFEILTTTPSPSLERRYWNRWQPVQSYRPFETYVLLREDVDIGALEERLQATMTRHLGEAVSENNVYHLQALDRMHLYSDADFGMRSHLNQDEGRARYGDVYQVMMVSLLALALLVIATANYANLSASRAITRAREVGVRKVHGAQRGALAKQFIGESMLLAVLAALIAVGIVRLLLPEYGLFLGKDLTLNPLSNPEIWLAGSATVFLVGLIGGCIPAIYLAAVSPVRVLDGRSAGGSRHASGLRKALVAFQFAIAAVLVAGTITVHRQLDFMLGKELGFATSGIVELDIFWKSRDVDGPNRLSNRYLQVKQAFLSHPRVLAASATGFPQDRPPSYGSYEAEGHTEAIRFGQFNIDESYFDLFGIEVIEGRNLTVEDRETEGPYSYLLNESAARILGWDDPIGKRFGQGRLDGVVVGVVKDFHLGSLHHPMIPLVFRQGYVKFLYLKILPERIDETITFIGETWRQLLPARPFVYSFLDDRVNRINYEREIRLAGAFSFFSGVSILVACLGLIGVVSFVAELRVKEVGIRMVLGASRSGVVLLFCRDYLWPLVAANALALPISYIAGNRWLENFAYRVDSDHLLLLATSVLTTLGGMATVAVLLNRVVKRDPAVALRE